TAVSGEALAGAASAGPWRSSKLIMVGSWRAVPGGVIARVQGWTPRYQPFKPRSSHDCAAADLARSPPDRPRRHRHRVLDVHPVPLLGGRLRGAPRNRGDPGALSLRR